jgi:diguanylate cyclase (GGDEF)-like protein/PAS domain S-box-containing protein
MKCSLPETEANAVSRRRDNDKTQQQLKKELTDLRRRIVELERAERVHEKEALRGSGEGLKTILDEIRHGIILLDLTGKVISINKRITEISGYTEKDVVGKRLNRLKMFPRQDITALLAAFAQVISGKTLTVEVEAYAKTGEKLIVEIDGTLLRIGGKTERVIAFLKDITARRQAEEALRVSEEELDAIFNEVRDGIILLDLTGRIIKINKRVAEVTKYSEKYIVGKRFNFFKNFTSDSIAKMIFNFSKAAAGYQVPPFEVIGYTKTGEKRVGEVYGSLVKKKGKAVGVLVVMTDITDRKQAEEALRESEKKHRTILETMEDGYFEVDLRGNFTFFNDALCRIHGRPREELMGMNNREYTTPETAKRIYAIFNKVYKTGIPATIADYEVIRKDGSVVMVEETASLLRNAAGKPIGFCVVSRDRTEQQKAEETLRESEQKHRDLVENINDIIYATDEHGIITYIAPRVEAGGYKTSEIVGRSFLDFVHEEDIPHMRNMFKQDIAGRPEPHEYRAVTKAGDVRWMRTSSQPFFREGRLMGVRGVATDITARKRAEEALRESEEKYRSILATMEEGYYEVDLRGNMTFCNDAVCRHHQRSRGELLGMNNREYMTPEMEKKIYAIFNKVYRTGIPAQFVDIEITRKDGTAALLEESVSLLHNAAGEPIGFYGVSRDRTAQKQAEEALRQSEEKYRTIIENIEDGYFEVDLAGNFTFVNDAACKIQGYTRDEMIGMNNREYMDKKTAQKVYKIFNTVLLTGRSATISHWQIFKKDKSRRDVESSVSLIRDARGNPKGFRGVIRDITARKQAEQELQYRATHDILTDLPNRLLFNDRLSLALAQAQRHQKKLAVMLLDLDYFKDVNDTLGHSIGDRLLRMVGNRLKELLRGVDTVARVGGDEFLLLLSEIGSIKDANSIAQKILEAFRQPFVLDDREITITTSIGIATFPDDGDNADILVKQADVAMYRAKDKGRDNFQRYTPA